MQDVVLLTTSEVAEHFRVDTAVVRRWVAKKQLLPAITTPGGHYRFNAADLEAFTWLAREQRLRVTIYHADDGWRWHAQAANNEIVASGEAYDNRGDAEHVTELIFADRADITIETAAEL